MYLSVRHALNKPVERRLGIETAGRVDLEAVGAAHPDREPYEPSGWLTVARALRRIDVGPSDVFLDYGCGKGRVVLAAARRPFRRVIGVEIAPELCEVARANLAADLDNRRCGSVEIVAADVTTWEVPDDVTTAFMYNPVRGDAFQAAMDRIIESLDRNPRRLSLIYSVPLEQERVLATGRARVSESLRGLRPGREWSAKMAVRIYALS